MGPMIVRSPVQEHFPPGASSPWMARRPAVGCTRAWRWSAHTEGCRSCRDERQDLMSLSTVLGTADPDRFNEHELPFRLQTAVLERLRAEERRERRARLSRTVLLVGRGRGRAWRRSCWC